MLHEGFYITGDIGYLDADGFLFVVDRLSRFSKVAGEMVPDVKSRKRCVNSSQMPTASSQELLTIGEGNVWFYCVQRLNSHETRSWMA